MVQYSLVIPCYNEEKNLPFLIDRIVKGYESEQDFEIILVNNGSNDGSASFLEAASVKYSFIKIVHVPVNKGYGYGILEGLSVARGQYLGWTHADMQTDPNDAKVGFSFFDAHPNPEQCFVKGLRYGRPFGDIFFTMGMSVFESLLFFLPLYDINAQPTLFSKEFYTTWKDAPYDFSLDLYAYASAVQQKRIPCRFSVNFANRLYGVSHWNLDWKSKMKFIKRTMDFSLVLKKTWRQ